jgi:putative ABC transport system ATP-binding protein
MAGINFKQSVWNAELRFEKGKHYLIKAPSGTGKSSFIAFLCGLRTDYSGVIQYDSTRLSKISLQQWAKFRQKNVSLVHQELRLFPKLTALENILIKARLSNTVTASEIKSMAARLGVTDKLDAPCGKLSMGQQQRIAIIRALVQPFDFLLLDEPFSHLDEQNIAKASALILEVCKSNKAGLLLTSLGASYDLEFDHQLTL